MALFSVNFYSRCLNRDVPINVLLPTDKGRGWLEGGAQQPLRTLYLLHGYRGNQSSYLLDMNVKKLTEDYNLAIVLPSGDNNFYLDIPACDEMCGEYTGRELVEYTRASFPLLSNSAEDTLIGGYSMGAYGALISGLKRPDTFGHIISNSSSLCRFFKHSADDAQADASGLNRFGINRGFYEQVFEPLEDVESSDKNPLALVDGLLARGADIPDIFISVGVNDELCLALREFVGQLRERGVGIEYLEYPGTHETTVFLQGLRDALARLYGEPETAPNIMWTDDHAPPSPKEGV